MNIDPPPTVEKLLASAEYISAHRGAMLHAVLEALAEDGKLEHVINCLNEHPFATGMDGEAVRRYWDFRDNPTMREVTIDVWNHHAGKRGVI